MNVINTGGWLYFDFIDELTLVLITHFVVRYTRKDAKSLDWTRDSNAFLQIPRALRCIGNNIYCVSRRSIHWLSHDLKDKKVIFEKENKEHG